MPDRLQLRRLAVLVLLLWLFGLASGVVNACVVTSGLRHAAHAAAVEAAHGHPGHGVHGAASDSAQHEDGQPSQPPCERLCEEPAAPTQADKQQATPLTGFWFAAAPLPVMQTWAAAVPPGAVAGTELAKPRPIPIPIAYLRLAL